MSKTKKEFVDLLVDQIIESNNISENIKGLKDEIKEAGFNATLLVTVAKSLAASKVGELQEKTEETLELIKELT